MKIKYLLAFLLLVPCVSADIVIQQVLYDPLNENGGEAVELKNTGSQPVDISGWTISTVSSLNDATIPEGSVILPGRTFLVADSGWSEKRDNPSWKLADYEEAITLSNTNGGVALIKGNDTIDSLCWGETDELDSAFGSNCAEKVSAGKALLRISHTGESSADFVEAGADFFDGILVSLTSEITLSVPVLEVSDSLDLAPEGLLSIRNNGDEAISVSLQFNDLYYKNYTIPKTSLEIEGSSEIVIQPNSEHKLNIKLNPPRNTQPGKYVSTLRVRILEENS